jgi:cytochrome c biogenesis protein CcmG, thiol:disulfide interchange protein DsbE
MRRPPLIVTLALAWVALGGCGESPEPERLAAGADTPELAAAERRLERESPPALSRLYADRGRVLGGGLAAFRERLAELRGHPAVVNKWASWCGPCRAELPFFRRQALARGRSVAFLGANTNDTSTAARRFLREVTVPFPSYADPEGDVARSFKGAIAFPTTAFYDRRGRLATVKQGVYRSERDLVADIERYAR